MCIFSAQRAGKPSEGKTPILSLPRSPGSPGSLQLKLVVQELNEVIGPTWVIPHTLDSDNDSGKLGLCYFLSPFHDENEAQLGLWRVTQIKELALHRAR